MISSQRRQGGVKWKLVRWLWVYNRCCCSWEVKRHCIGPWPIHVHWMNTTEACGSSDGIGGSITCLFMPKHFLGYAPEWCFWHERAGWRPTDSSLRPTSLNSIRLRRKQGWAPMEHLKSPHSWQHHGSMWHLWQIFLMCWDYHVKRLSVVSGECWRPQRSAINSWESNCPVCRGSILHETAIWSLEFSRILGKIHTFGELWETTDQWLPVSQSVKHTGSKRCNNWSVSPYIHDVVCCHVNMCRR